ncbi:MAG: hypothetical protein WAX69_14605, partial [Victivallales bacterium]
MNNKNLFVIGNEYGLGYWIKDGKPVEWEEEAPDIYPSSEWNKKLRLCNGFRIIGDSAGSCRGKGLTKEDMEKLSEDGKYFIMIDFFRCHPQTIDMVMELMKSRKHGNKLWACLFGERDGSYSEWTESHPDYFATRREAAEYFKKWLCKEATVWGEKGVTWYFRDLKNKCLPQDTFANHVKQNSFPEWANMVAHSSALYVLHHYYEWGFNAVWLERNVWFSNLNVSIAFQRGAARQYDGYWFNDFSAWGGLFITEHLPVHYDEQGIRQGGGEESSYLRGWLMAFLAGSNFDFQEATEVGYFLPWNDKSKSPELSKLGIMAKGFADFAIRRHPDRGEPHVPFCLLLEHDHGWDAPVDRKHEHVAWCGKVPYEDGDYMIENFFEAAFPGYKTSGNSYERTFDPSVPWKDEGEYFNLLKGGYDMRPFTKGQLTSTRWGDSFDVLLENASVDVLQKYPVITLLGRIQLNKELLEKLKVYVKQGGTLILSGRQMSAE